MSLFGWAKGWQEGKGLSTPGAAQGTELPSQLSVGFAPLPGLSLPTAGTQLPGKQLSFVLPEGACLCILAVESTETHSSLADQFRLCSSAGLGR